jgi:hypothetical protein
VISRNGLNRTAQRLRAGAHRAAVAKPESKFLNHRTESCARGVVTNLAATAKIFNKFFTIGGREGRFSERLKVLWG